MLLPETKLVFVLFLGVSILFELIALLVSKKNHRIPMAVLSIISVTFSGGLLLAWQFTAGSILVATISIYRAFNMMRIIEGRMNKLYLNTAVKKSSIYLISFQILALLLYWSWRHLNISSSPKVLISFASYFLLITSSILTLNIALSLAKAKRLNLNPKINKSKLPTLSILIPARNETADLTQCLESLVKSDYPKLEIIVLDDCSQDKTSQIIKEFAKKGVRFIKGKQTPVGWLSKNYAYKQLALEAKGELLLFVGVDIRFSESSITELVSEYKNSSLDMISILPKRQNQSIWGSVVQPMRYWWELAMPKANRRPPVLSTCWLIAQKSFKKIGGMEAVARSIIPEIYFAKKLGERYKFVRTDKNLGVSSLKNLRDQIETAIRTRYPQVHRRLEMVLFLSIFEIVVLLSPFIIATYGIFFNIRPEVWISGIIAAIILTAGHIYVTISTNPGAWLLSVINFPFIVIIEFILLNISMYQYEFSTVEWKGRNICLPVMNTYSSLPKF